MRPRPNFKVIRELPVVESFQEPLREMPPRLYWWGLPTGLMTLVCVLGTAAAVVLVVLAIGAAWVR